MGKSHGKLHAGGEGPRMDVGQDSALQRVGCGENHHNVADPRLFSSNEFALFALDERFQVLERHFESLPTLFDTFCVLLRGAVRGGQ